MVNMPTNNQVQLITYPDSLGGDLKSLNQVLRTHFADIFKGGVHILPPFPSSGDRGFAPLTYLEIEPEFGTWEDIRAVRHSRGSDGQSYLAEVGVLPRLPCQGQGVGVCGSVYYAGQDLAGGGARPSGHRQGILKETEALFYLHY